MGLNSKHTPGPLELVQSAGVSNNGSFHLYLTDANGRKIAALWGGEDEKLANGFLFAAAPKLLAVCKAMLPTGICITNKNIRDDMVVPIEVTMGELRALAAVIVEALPAPAEAA